MNTKTCRTCAETKPEEEFHWKKVGRWRRTECNACHSIRNRRNYANRRDGLSVTKVLPDIAPLIRCSRCKEAKPRDAFTRNAARPNGLNNQCTLCRRAGYARSAPRVLAGRRSQYAADPVLRARIIADRRRRDTGATCAEYEVLCMIQEHKCYLCAETCTSGKALSMDHDHATGRLRRPLCGRCNLTLGKVHDDTALLRRMADYVDQFRAEIVDFADKADDITEAF